MLTLSEMQYFHNKSHQEGHIFKDICGGLAIIAKKKFNFFVCYRESSNKLLATYYQQLDWSGCGKHLALNTTL